jgi:thiol-disulfide isomerase/thioredoxin
MKHMNIFGLILMGAMTLNSCGDTPAQAQEKQEQTVAAPIYTNGITDANKGMKKGPVEVKGTMTAKNFKKIYLFSLYGKTATKIDSADVVNGNWTFGTNQMEQGFYQIGVADNNVTSFIVNPTEPVVEIGFRSGKMEGSLYAINSKENEAWVKYVPQEAALLKAIKDARVSAHKSTMKAEFEKQAAAKELELSELQAKMIGEYPNTHFAKVLTWKQEPEKTDIGKYWDNIDFSDQSLIHGVVLSDRIQNFMRSFSKGVESGFINCIATVAEKAKADDIVLEFALNQMLIGFYESGMENICTFMIDNYINGDSCGDADLSNVIKSTAESIQKLSVGNTPPNIQMADINGANVDLFKLAAKNKYTLVMFWSSWCEHCKGEAPEVKQAYDQWHAKGFEILGVSVDNVKINWENAVKDRGFTFPNVCGMKLWDSKPAKDYRVTKTPVFYLLDSTGKIVLKPKGIREVQTFLSKNLK